jgi:putative ABC transport system permease protein
MTALRFALRLFRRDWRNGELRLLALALVLAVAAVSAVGFFTDRVGQAMELQAGEALAADLVLSSHNPLDARYREKAAELALESAQTLGFPSAVLHGDETRLVMVKAVSSNYPLRGELRTRDTPAGAEQRAERAPADGEIWADARLFADLEVAVGDPLTLGEQNFRLAAVISRDSGEASNMFRLGPSILLNLADIPATGLVTPASRVHHRLLVAGTPDRVQAYRLWAEANLEEGVKLNHMSNARPALRNALDRGSRFLGLSALVAVLIASAAVALSSRRFVERQADASAVLRCLGATRPLLLQVLLVRLLLLLLAASAIGLLLGYLAQLVLAAMVAQWFTTELPQPGLYPLAIGVGTGVVTLLGFTLPPVLRLGSVPPLRVLRRDLELPPIASWVLALCAFAALALLMLWQAGEARLALLVMFGALASVALLLAAARLMVALLTPLRHHSSAIWRYGLAGLARNPALTSLQMAGFGLGILALLLLTLVRVDLLAAWERTIPDDAPNQFLINIQPDQVAPLQSFLQEQTASSNAIYPMLRARLTQINSNAVSAQKYDDPDAQAIETACHWLGREQSPVCACEILGPKMDVTRRAAIATKEENEGLGLQAVFRLVEQAISSDPGLNGRLNSPEYTDEVKAEMLVDHLAERCSVDSESIKATHPDQVRRKVISIAEHGYRDGVLSAIQGLGAAAGFTDRRGTNKIRYAPTDKLLRALVLANVTHQVEEDELLLCLNQRYHLVIGPREAALELQPYFHDEGDFKKNKERFARRLAGLGLAQRMSDACTYVRNPYFREKG